MARIAGVDLPRRKHLAFALPYLYGIGPKTARDICSKTGIPGNKRVEELSDFLRERSSTRDPDAQSATEALLHLRVDEPVGQSVLER